MSNFTDKIVVITGGSDGIGKALVAQFLALGAKVATCGRNENKLSLLASEFPSSNLYTAQVDVSKQEQSEAFIKQVVDNWGRIDILINNAGISMRALVSEVSVQTLHNVMDINFWGTVYCTKFALDPIIKNKIITISNIHYPKIDISERKNFNDSKGITFIGSIHEPNIDAVKFLYEKITSTPKSYASLEDIPIADFISMVAEEQATYKTTAKSSKSLKKEYYESRK